MEFQLSLRDGNLSFEPLLVWMPTTHTINLSQIRHSSVTPFQVNMTEGGSYITGIYNVFSIGNATAITCSAVLEQGLRQAFCTQVCLCQCFCLCSVSKLSLKHTCITCVTITAFASDPVPAFNTCNMNIRVGAGLLHPGSRRGQGGCKWFTRAVAWDAAPGLGWRQVELGL